MEDSDSIGSDPKDEFGDGLDDIAKLLYDSVVKIMKKIGMKDLPTSGLKYKYEPGLGPRWWDKKNRNTEDGVEMDYDSIEGDYKVHFKIQKPLHPERDPDEIDYDYKDISLSNVSYLVKYGTEKFSKVVLEELRKYDIEISGEWSIVIKKVRVYVVTTDAPDHRTISDYTGYALMFIISTFFTDLKALEPETSKQFLKAQKRAKKAGMKK